MRDNLDKLNNTTMTDTLVENPPIKPPDVPAVAVAAMPEDAPKKTKKAAASKAKFTRDAGNFKQDGTALLQEYNESYTEDACPKNEGHDINKIVGTRNGKKLVECVFCGATFESAEPTVI